MLKTILYLGLVALGLTAALGSPLIAAIVNMQVYFVNPYALARREISFQRYQFISSLILIATIVFYSARGLKPIRNEGRLLIAMWVYTGLAMLSSLSAHYDSANSFEEAYQFSKTVLAATLFTLVVRSERDFTLVVRACVFGVGHLAFLDTWGKHKLDWINKLQPICTDRIGSVILLFLPLVILLGIYGNKLEKVFCWLSLPFILDAIVRTDHRAYFLGLTVQAGLVVIFLPKRIVKRLLPILAVGVWLFVFVLTPPRYWQWMSTIKNPTQEGSANSRFVIWRAGAQVFKNYPWGVGYDCFPGVMARYLPGDYVDRGIGSHSTYLSVACETGVQGFAAWTVAVGGAILAFRKIRKQANYERPTRLELYAMGFEFGFYGTLVGDCFHKGNEIDPVYWLVGFAVVLTRLRYAQTPTTIPHADGHVPAQQFASRELATV